MSRTRPQIGSPGLVQRFRGRRWLAAYLWVMALICLGLAGATVLLGWPGMLFMGLPALFAGYFCLTYGWGEAVARVELRADGFSLRLPDYRGYFPFWPAYRLEGKWPEVTAIRRCHVRAKCLGIRFDYVMHSFETRDGGIMLLEQLPNELSRDSRKSGLNLPAPAIAAEFARRAGLEARDDGEMWGGGLWRNLVSGGPARTESARLRAQP